MAVRRSGWTRPGAIDPEEGRKGTAAADPVVMVTPNGNIPGVIVERAPADAVAAVRNGADKGAVANGTADKDTADKDGEKDEPKDTRSPTQIEADLDRTREHLSSTLDELSERLSPRDLARRGGLQVKGQFVDLPSGRLRSGRVAAAGGGVAGAVGALVLLRRFGRRSRDC